MKFSQLLIQTAKSNYIPKRVWKFNKRHYKKENWMTDELLAKAIKKNKIYLDWKTTPITYPDYENVKLKFKAYEQIVFEGDRKGIKGIFRQSVCGLQM